MNLLREYIYEIKHIICKCVLVGYVSSFIYVMLTAANNG